MLLLDALFWLLALVNVQATPPDTYVTKWYFSVTQDDGKATQQLYNAHLDMTAEVSMPMGHRWFCERMAIQSNDDGTLEEGSFVCANGDAMFTVTSVCETSKGDANQASSVLIVEDNIKMVFTVVCRTDKLPPAKKKP
jgi:hypothetical protein